MLSNGIKETTSTTGTGTVTLSSVAGSVRFSQGFIDGADVSYAIKDGDNWEWGIGTVGAGNTLARTTVAATLSAGTYAAYPGTGLNLSGSAEVICTPHGTTTDSYFLPGRRSNVMHSYLTGKGDYSTTNGVLTANTARFYRAHFQGGVYTGAKLTVTTAVAATVARIAIYTAVKSAADSLINGISLIAQTDDLITTTTGDKSGAFTGGEITLNTGWYTVGIVASGAINTAAWSYSQFGNSPFDGFGRASYEEADYGIGGTVFPSLINTNGVGQARSHALVGLYT